jgi:hypothetical protein
MFRATSAAIAAIATVFCLSAQAADDPATGISRSEAKDLKTQSEAQYKARNKVAEAQETLNRADCKTALEGSAKRACEKTAKSAAKTQKSAAKTVHEAEEDAIKDAKK